MLKKAFRKQYCSCECKIINSHECRADRKRWISAVGKRRKIMMEILEVYREKCEKSESENTRSYGEYNGNTIVCKDCEHRKVKK